MDVFGVVVLVFVVLVAVKALLGMKRPPDYPPGPARFPLIGSLWYLLSFGSKPSFVPYQILAKKYGKIFSIKLGQIDAVVLSDPKEIRHVLAKDEASGRLRLACFDILYWNQNLGLIFSDGQPWREQRRFCLKTLRDFGLGKAAIEDQVKDEMKELVEEMRSELNAAATTNNRNAGPDKVVGRSGKSCAVKMDQRLAAAVLNSLWMVTASKRFDLNDPNFKKYVGTLRVDLDRSAILSYMPSVIKILPHWVSGLNDAAAARDLLQGYIGTIIEEHRQTFDPQSPRDLIDKFFSERDSLEKQGITDHSFTDLNLPSILADIFVAGAETTSTTLRWFILYMVHYPKVQKKIQEEVDKVVGRDRRPCWEDNLSMHYTQATIHEVWRIVTIAPLGIDHRLHEGMKIGNYWVPKDTMIQTNIYGVHHDPDFWDNPNDFQPERFLDGDGKFVRTHEALMPFQTGKRQCLGETMARMTTFLATTTLLQAFTFDKIPGAKYSLETRAWSNVVNLPNPVEVLITARDGTR